MQFMHQSKRAICILSASGSISSASLHQPAAYGGQMTIEVQNYYDIFIHHHHHHNYVIVILFHHISMYLTDIYLQLA
jgi:hypothetical protein